MELSEKDTSVAEKKERKGKCVTCGKVIHEGISPIRRRLDPDFVNSECRECLKEREK